ncbi:hypothetical protein SAMN02746095_01623 [Acidocella aminolytica 101 = DSM 11237]|nr:hypothetical protein SAMN02746095_01623 [Acidocella aminolytica 101 = DSM 11237]
MLFTGGAAAQIGVILLDWIGGLWLCREAPSQPAIYYYALFPVKPACLPWPPKRCFCLAYRLCWHLPSCRP